MRGMHTPHNHSHAPETAGHTLIPGLHYDLISKLMGMGVNDRNSRMVVELAQVQAGHKVLDVGCGTGSLTLTVKTYTGASGEVVGIDASPEMIDAARKKTGNDGGQVTFEIGLIEKIPYPEAAFDVVISRLAIHHLPDDLKRIGFEEIYRVLKPGGHLLVADFKPPDNFLLQHIALVFFGHGMMSKDVREIPPLVKQAGFVEISINLTRSAFMGYVSGTKPLS
jgi:demethylmenaquinone methyltransferase/2-methoxy-6-polyprenyl-1,4-benzoquinol methylase/phosphoethanolamine N-methyltransferase